MAGKPVVRGVFAEKTSASGIAVEGLVLEILAEIARSESKPDAQVIPRWLKHATEIVESRFLERLSLAAIAPRWESTTCIFHGSSTSTIAAPSAS